MLVFLATPYSQLCDEKYNVKNEFRPFFMSLIERIKDLGVDYFLAIERENYGKEYTSDQESTKVDFETIKKSHLVCVIPGNPASGGVHVELGWASANQKQIEIFLNRNRQYSPMVTGLSGIANVQYHYYETDYSDKVIELICSSIERYLNEVESE